MIWSTVWKVSMSKYVRHAPIAGLPLSAKEAVQALQAREKISSLRLVHVWYVLQQDATSF